MIHKKWFPWLPEPNLVKTAHWVNAALLTLAAVIIGMGFIVPLVMNPSLLQFNFVLINLISLAVIGLALVMVHYGYVTLGATLSILFLFAAVTYANVSIFGSGHSPNLLAYFVLIPLTGLVLQKRAMLLVSLLSIIAVTSILLLELTGMRAAQPQLQPQWDDLLVWLLALVFNTALLVATIHRAEESADTARQALIALEASQTQLQQSLAKEKELSELKSRFVSMASHEFRTPLTTIFTLTEILQAYRHKLTDHQINERLEKMKDQVSYLTGIMEDVLQLARLQARRIEFNPEWLDLDALYRSIVEEFQSHPQTVHRLSYTADQTLVQMYLDKRLIRQIVSNLISNALKYSPPEKTVTLRLRQEDTEVLLEVSDEGIAIPPADLPHLFEPFHRGENVGLISGTGLGMVIIKEAVELHGGAITVESQMGVGTTITVRLPVPENMCDSYAKHSRN